MSKKIDKTILKIFMWGLPVVFLLVVILEILGSELIEQNSIANNFNSIAGFLIVAWVISTLYLTVKLVFSESMRSMVLPRLVFLKEADEREQYLTADAMRNSFLITLAIFILLFCASVFRISLYQKHFDEPNVTVSEKRALNIGVSLSLLESKSDQEANKEDSRLYLFRYQGLPFSDVAIFLFLIIWQIGSYNYFVRRSLYSV